MINLKTYLCIDVGGTFLKSAILDSDGHLLSPVYTIHAHPEGTKEQVLESLRDVIRNGLDVIKESQYWLSGIGLAFPGPFDYHNGIPLMKHKYASIYNTGLRQYLSGVENLIPNNIPICFLHDVEAVLRGEMWKGYAREYPNAAIVTLGTGLGFSFSRDGAIQRNELGGPAISAFKLPYGAGILEDYVSKRGLLKIYAEISGQHSLNGITVAKIGTLADHGDNKAADTFYKAGEILANALHEILVNENIECLLFAGQISKSFRHMENSLKKGLNDISGLKKIAPVDDIDLAAFRGILRLIASPKPLSKGKI